MITNYSQIFKNQHCENQIFFLKKMLIPLPNIFLKINFFGGELDPFVNYFVKVELDKYHKIVIPTQHWTL